MNYRKSNPSVRKAYFEWEKQTPELSHHTVSFVAGYNAAIKDMRESIQADMDKASIERRKKKE